MNMSFPARHRTGFVQFKGWAASSQCSFTEPAPTLNGVCCLPTLCAAGWDGWYKRINEHFLNVADFAVCRQPDKVQLTGVPSPSLIVLKLIQQRLTCAALYEPGRRHRWCRHRSLPTSSAGDCFGAAWRADLAMPAQWCKGDTIVS
jgi:hypothetical protein